MTHKESEAFIYLQWLFQGNVGLKTLAEIPQMPSTIIVYGGMVGNEEKNNSSTSIRFLHIYILGTSLFIFVLLPVNSQNNSFTNIRVI